MQRIYQPRNVFESQTVALFVLGVSGLFPLKWDTLNKTFAISWPKLLLTFLHLIFYFYVNITLMLEDWEDYSQPVMGTSWITARINFVLRLLSILITIWAFIPVLVFRQRNLDAFNAQLEVLEIYENLEFDTKRIYKKMQYLATMGTLLVFLFVSFGCWHSLYFFQLITHREAVLMQKISIILSTYYKAMNLLFLWHRLYTSYIFGEEMTCILEPVLASYKLQQEGLKQQKLKRLRDRISKLPKRS